MSACPRDEVGLTMMVWAGAPDLVVYIIQFHQRLLSVSTDLCSLFAFTSVSFIDCVTETIRWRTRDFCEDILSLTIAMRKKNGIAVNSPPTSSN